MRSQKASKYVVQRSSILAAESPGRRQHEHPDVGHGGDARPERRASRAVRSGLVSSVVIGMASTAPAYSLAASLGLIVVLAGEKAPAIMLLAFVPMYLIAVAYRELNEAEPDCGTTFTWAARAFGPRTGWMGGWGIIAADIIVMANLAQIAGSYSFRLFGRTSWPTSSCGPRSPASCGSSLMTYICYRGIEVSARMQYALLGDRAARAGRVRGDRAGEGVLGRRAGGFDARRASTGCGRAGCRSRTSSTPSSSPCSCTGAGTPPSRSTRRPTTPATTPGRAAVLSTVLLLVTYVLVAVATVAFAGTGTEGIGLGNPDNADDVFAAIGPAVFGDSGIGQVFVVLLIISVLTSSAASTQTTILPTARAALSMGAYRAIPPRFAKIHPRYLTPSYATWGMGIASIVVLRGADARSARTCWPTRSPRSVCSSRSTTASPASPASGTSAGSCTGRDLWVKGVLPAARRPDAAGRVRRASITTTPAPTAARPPCSASAACS